MTPASFLASLAATSFPNTFNPYSDRCRIHDLPDAPQRRRATLLAMLEAAAGMGVEAIWVARDLGHRGGRRTGLALTDDVHLDTHGRRWDVSPSRSTHGHEIAERTAAVVWRLLSHINQPVFLWNVFPLHPHEVNAPFTNRAHNTGERQAGEELLSELIKMLKPARLIAIGNDAARSANRVCNQGISVLQARHPSYGGHIAFRGAITAAYDLSAGNPPPALTRLGRSM